jgi:hypothetical protein
VQRLLARGLCRCARAAWLACGVMAVPPVLLVVLAPLVAQLCRRRWRRLVQPWWPQPWPRVAWRVALQQVLLRGSWLLPGQLQLQLAILLCPMGLLVLVLVLLVLVLLAAPASLRLHVCRYPSLALMAWL